MSAEEITHVECLNISDEVVQEFVNLTTNLTLEEIMAHVVGYTQAQVAAELGGDPQSAMVFRLLKTQWATCYETSRRIEVSPLNLLVGRGNLSGS